jgi:DAACS family dicarboxylate/amino acid:cation (Na+ or H+) symporter
MANAGSAHNRILVGLAAGAVCGVVANVATQDSERGREVLGVAIDAVAFPVGQVFLRLLFVVVMPLVFASIAVGVTGLGDLKRLGGMGARTLAFFLFTSAASAVLGIGALHLVKPGVGFDAATVAELQAKYAGDTAGLAAKRSGDSSGDFLTRLDRTGKRVDDLRGRVDGLAGEVDTLGADVRAGRVGDSPGDGTEPGTGPGDGTGDGAEPGTGSGDGAGAGAGAAAGSVGAAAPAPVSLKARVTQILDMFLPRNLGAAVVEMQMIPLIVFALVLGAALLSLEERKRTALVTVLEAIGDAMVVVVGFAMKLAPYAVFCLIFGVTAQFGLAILQKLGLYFVLIVGCYLVQLFGLYPLLIALVARRSPLEFLKRAAPVMVTALSTSSSSATLPTSLRVAKESLGIRPQVAGFVLPLGATMNMNGTALFEGAVVLFVAQVFGIELSLEQQALVVGMCVLTAIGAAGVPGGSLPLLMGVMAQVGVPPEGIAIVLGVDRVLDMGRTVVNVMGDQVCAAYIERVEAGRAA